MRLPELLKDRLRGRLPGPDLQAMMSPRGRPRLSDLDRADSREAGVMALLHPFEGDAAVLLIERPVHLKKHAGQIAFPGGRREEGESRLEAALRETWEEVGVSVEDIGVLGSLTPLFVPPSRFCVYPYVGWIDELPPLTLDPGEVATAFSAPLETFVDHAPGLMEVPRLKRSVPAYHVGDYRVWGATAMILAELAAVLEPILPRG